MKKAVLLLLALFAVGMIATSALAGEREGALSLSPFIGGYTFDGTQNLKTAPVFGIRAGYDLTKEWGVELVGDFLDTSRTTNGADKKMVSYRLDVLYNFLPAGPLVPYLAVGGGGLTYGGGGIEINIKNTDATANLGGGLKYFLSDSMALRGDGRMLLVFEDPNPPKYNWEYSIGVSFLFGGSKPAMAAKPAAPAAAPVVAAPAAAPAPQAAQTAPAAPAAVVAEPAVQPPPAAEPVPPVSAPIAILKVIPDSITATQPATLAWSSRDAVKCEIQPGIGPVETAGSLTVTPSADSDYTLTCEGPGGRKASAVHLTVAPAPAPTPVVPVEPVPKAPAARAHGMTIEFASASSEVAASYHKELREIARYLKAHPEKKAMISGYSDNIGGDASNQAASVRRAQAVKTFLVKQAVKASRLTVKGYGSSNPVADNTTSDGRQANRRVVVTVVP
jgi:OOP family OmpA-OmpF porin